MPIPILRVARPTDNLATITAQYIDGLGLTLLSSFSEHEEFSGSIIGHPKAPYHFEFTTFHGEGWSAGRAPTEDNLLVFYVGEDEWEERVLKMRSAGWKEVESFNPWWDRGGQTFEDVDGYRVVLYKEPWNL